MRTAFRDWSESLLQRSGENYLLLALLISQVVANLGAIPAAYFVQINAEIAPELFRKALGFLLLCTLLGYLILALFVYRATPHARRRLQIWAAGKPLSANTSDEAKAWEEITALGWKYGLGALLVLIFVDILPLLFYEALFLKLSSDQIIYTFIGASIAAGGGLLLNVFLLEQLLAPARRILTPQAFEVQAAHFRGLPLFIRLILTVTVLVAVSIALVAPIGYHQTFLVLYREVDSIQVLQQLQVRSIVVSLAALLLGFGLAVLLSRSVANPLRHLIEVFAQVESGGLDRRAAVIGTDEAGQLAIYFNRMLARIQYLQENLEQEVVRRTAQLKTTLEVGQAASSILDPDELMERVVQLISERFGYYYVALFLVDESGQWAELKHAIGEAGRLLKQKGHRLEVGGKSMVGTAITTRQARIALDVGEEAVRFDNPLLPYTRSEIALPLIVGGQVLGALDVQSTQPAAFSEADIETLQGMANQVAIAIQNARLFRNLQQNLQEMHALQRQYLRQSWGEFLSQHRIHYEIGESDPSAAKVEIPLALREEVLGRIALEGDLTLTDEEEEWLETLAAQAALAMESARVLEESTRQAELERLAATIVQKARQTLDTQTILRTAARELQQNLRLPEVVLHFGPPPES